MSLLDAPLLSPNSVSQRRIHIFNELKNKETPIYFDNGSGDGLREWSYGSQISVTARLSRSSLAWFSFSRKELKQISIDDTIAGELDKLIGVRASRSRWDAFASQLTQFVGIGKAMEPRIFPVSSDVTDLLTSDGIHGMKPRDFGNRL